MKLAVLIGASAQILESPMIPLGPGSHKLYIDGLKDSHFIISYADGTKDKIHRELVIQGPCSFKLIMDRKGTEKAGEISAYVDGLPPALVDNIPGDDNGFVTG